MQEEVALYKDQIAEAVAMGDDELMEKFFSGEEFSDAELKRGVRIGVRNGEICPVYSGRAVNSIGIQRLIISQHTQKEVCTQLQLQMVLKLNC